MKISDLLLQTLKDNGVQYIFGNPGTTETPFMNSIEGELDIVYILSLQEGSVIGMAAGYALASNSIGFINVHTYPGLANSMCNLFSAHKANIPLVITAGQQDRRHLKLHPTLAGPLTELAATATKSSVQIEHEYDFQLLFQQAFNVAKMAPTGPSFVALPMDLINGEVDEVHELQPLNLIKDHGIHKEDLSGLVELLALETTNTVIVVDRNGKEANNEILELAELLQADLYTSPFPNQIPISTDHYLYKGGFPSFASKQSEVLEHADVCLLIGNDLGYFLYDQMNSIPNSTKLIHLNDSSNSVAQRINTHLALVGNIKATTQAINQLLIQKGVVKPYFHQEKYEHHLEYLKLNNETLVQKEEAGFSVDKITAEVLNELDDSQSIVIEAGSFESTIKNNIFRSVPGTVYTAPKGGGLGWAMPFANGVALHEKNHVICFVGDGGAEYSIHSIYTAAKFQLPVIFICLNNGAYEVLKELWKYQYPKSNEENYNVMNLNPSIDLIKIATGYGAQCHNPENYTEFRNALKEALSFQGPTFINVKLPNKTETLAV